MVHHAADLLLKMCEMLRRFTVHSSHSFTGTEDAETVIAVGGQAALFEIQGASVPRADV